MFAEFQSAKINVGETRLFIRRAGNGAPLLLLHGFPQTHVMWRDIAPLLKEDFTVICADLRGYGQSDCPASLPDHSPYSKKTMAADMVKLMACLGFESFSVAGHDRGARVACRMALDYPERIRSAVVMDIIPTEETWKRTDVNFALAYWPWSLLAQPAPLPERLLLSAPDAIINNAFDNWGSHPALFPQEIRAIYVQSLQNANHAHAICEEYRAAATIDREQDRTDYENGRRIACPLLVLWSHSGALGSWYVEEGGPLAIWKKWALNVRGKSIRGGHFFPEELPESIAETLGAFFQSIG